MQIEWMLKPFNALSAQELYAVLRLRSEVFVVEQNCVFLDMDNIDQHCLHLMGQQNGRLVAYTRLVPPGVTYPEASIGRVVSSPAVRGSGIGRQLMQQSISHVYAQFGRGPIKIGAQLYLKRFYESLGFEKSSAVYLEDGIEHIYMIKALDT